MANNRDEGGCATVIGGAGVVLIALIAAIPKSVWIALGIIIAVAVLIGVTVKIILAIAKALAAAKERARVQRAIQAAAAKREQEESARKRKQKRIDTLGAENAALVERARAAVKQVVVSDAARAGWLGDVDFTAEVRGIVDSFQKAHSLRKVAQELSALNRRSPDDDQILADATATAASLECAAVERVELIEKCATEAHLIDESQRSEREDARAAEQRAELHARLSAMVYGIETNPDATPKDSAAEAVMARVQAYRDIEDQIQQVRDSRFR